MCKVKTYPGLDLHGFLQYYCKYPNSLVVISDYKENPRPEKWIEHSPGLKKFVEYLTLRMGSLS